MSSGRLRAHQEGEAVAMKSVRKHHLVLSLELKRLQMERLVSERYYAFERALVQARLNRLISRQKELGIYRPMSPLKQSMRIRRDKTKEQPSFFLTSAPPPPVRTKEVKERKGIRVLPRIIDQNKQQQKLNSHMASLQDRIAQFNNYKKGAPHKNMGLDHTKLGLGIKLSAEIGLEGNIKTAERSNDGAGIRTTSNNTHAHRQGGLKPEAKDSGADVRHSTQENTKLQNSATENQTKLKLKDATGGKLQMKDGTDETGCLRKLNGAMDNLTMNSGKVLKSKEPKRRHSELDGLDLQKHEIKNNQGSNVRPHSAC